MDWKMRPAGLSRDARTNVWEITPPCGHRPFTPQTTRFNVQVVECPKCGIKVITNYNDNTITEYPND